MSELSRIIAEEIRRNGPVSVARFMELALYCPVYGYYERDPDSIGKQGDFQTSVSVGTVFGELIATRIASWLDQLKAQECSEIHLVEAGAHHGQLTLDILSWLSHWRTDLSWMVYYHLLEPSARRRQWQRERFAGRLERVRWAADFDELRQLTGGVHGVFFSNEVLDAMPTHRYAWDRARCSWFEWMVDGQEGRFLWAKGGEPGENCSAAIDRMVPPELREVLPDGYVIEYSPAAVDWWVNATRSLDRGWLVTFDYGLADRAVILPERMNGTLRGYRSHQTVSEVLANPGQQDITAHVNFNQIRSAGEEAGLKTEFFGEQERFLVQALKLMNPSDQHELPLDAGRLRQIKTLIHPDHFGRLFKVLVQSRL